METDMGSEKNVEKRSMQNHCLEDLFKECDTKGVGVIGPEEFRELCNNFGISSADSDAIFLDLDHDEDGFINFDDFAHGFRDFLTTGDCSRSAVISNGSVNDSNDVKNKHFVDLKRRQSLTAWKHFISNVGPSNIQTFMPKREQIYENDPDAKKDGSLEVALKSLVMEVQHLHEEYKNLEDSFRKEREVHAAQLVALGEELDQQLAKAEVKAKQEARQEAQRQMNTERKKIATEIESQLADLSSQIRAFQKVEEWLGEEQNPERRAKAPISKLNDAENENRSLKSALVEAQIKATLLQTQLVQRRNEYLDLFNALHTEKVAASEYKNQVDLMQDHLAVLSEANRFLSDANDCLTTKVPSESGFVLNRQQCVSVHPNSSNSCPNSLGFEGLPDPNCISLDQSMLVNRDSGMDKDVDSGRSTLFLHEQQVDGDGSPLPSGIWTSLSSNSSKQQAEIYPQILQPQNQAKLHDEVQVRNSAFSTNSFHNGDNDGLSKSLSSRDGGRNEFIRTSSENWNTESSDPYSLDDSKACLDSQSPFYPHRTFKVILAGDAAVGKTTFIERICHGHFTPNLSSTIGVDFRVKTIELDGKLVALQLWDTAGQERFRSLTKSYFRRADGVILMYDVSNERTFTNIQNWIHNIEEGAVRKVPIVLSGNKVDLREQSMCQQRQRHFVSQKDGHRLALQCGAIFIETSPKTGQNVFEALIMLAKEMSEIEDAELRNSLQLAASTEDKIKKKGCCSNGNYPKSQQESDLTGHYCSAKNFE